MASPAPRLQWSGNISLAWRILAINILVVTMVGVGLFYLDSFRARLVEDRRAVLMQHAHTLRAAWRNATPDEQPQILLAFARVAGARVRVYAPGGAKVADSFALAPPNFELRNPAEQPWQRDVARLMDAAIDRAARAPIPPPFRERARDVAASWPEVRLALRVPGGATAYRFAPDRTPVISAALRDDSGAAIHLLGNARDITRAVRAERLRLGKVLLAAVLLSLLLSLFLARTIVRPLQSLAAAATLVRLGRAREVEVPRLPERRDEIGRLARAISDMAGALRARIDAGERLAADMAHELKNPLASLRSSLEGAERIADPALKQRLLAIAAADVQRLDRLITDIADASRLDAQLTRTHFTRFDLGALVESDIQYRRERAGENDPGIAFARPHKGSTIVVGDVAGITRVIDNLIDNAASFSPPGSVITVSVTNDGGAVVMRVEDEGPGVPPEQREEIFRRFHSLRDGAGDFGKHSGLGLAIVRTIAEAHGGSVACHSRKGGRAGACFQVTLPAVVRDHDG